MPGDYSRSTFDPAKHYSAVLLQQGRVLLDADWNEYRDVVMHQVRALAADLIGPHGGPGDGFKIVAATDESGHVLAHDFGITAGHYYVEGVLCENDADLRFSQQPGHRSHHKQIKDDRVYLVYLDVWEQEITSLEDDTLREVALKGPDTAARLRVVWQVSLADTQEHDDFDDRDPEGWLIEHHPQLSNGTLKAQALTGTLSDGPCTVSPDSRYRGVENQLYRVEIHQGGSAGDATFVWSRDNGAVSFAVTDVHDQGVTVEDLGADDRLTLRPGEWVEVLEDDAMFHHRVSDLLMVRSVDPSTRLVTVHGAIHADTSRSPILRRWDHGRGLTDADLVDGAMPVREGEWINLEAGVQIWFDAGGLYRSGDYWQIPARTATGDVDWPGPPGAPISRPPNGVHHHTAPLMLITVTAGQMNLGKSYRKRIQPIVKSD